MERISVDVRPYMPAYHGTRLTNTWQHDQCYIRFVSSGSQCQATLTDRCDMVPRTLPSLPASRQNHPPNSRGQGSRQGQYILPTTHSATSPPPSAAALKTLQQTPACVISKLFHFFLFTKKIIIRGVDMGMTGLAPVWAMARRRPI